jgi:sugar phosphate isomerase/epimerase
MKANTIAAQLYTLREFTKTPQDIRDTMKKVREMGYEVVQVSGMGAIDPAELKSIVDEYGLKICITHTPYDRIINDFDNVVREHKLWECEYIGLGSMPGAFGKEPGGFERSREGYTAFAHSMSEVAKKYNDAGLKFVYHNHNVEFQKYDGITGMDIILEESDPEAFGFEIDTYWVQAGGADPVEWIYKVKGRMGVVHLKDMAIVDGEQLFAEIGEGNLKWNKIIKACEETGVKWYAIEQDKCMRNPFESLKMSFDYLVKEFC